MSHTALRRVAIRLLHDPIFVDALHADATRALAAVALSSEERRWLVAVPRAAWRTDPARPERVLAALCDEFPASVALAPRRAEAFFQSAEFHGAVQERGSLAIAFGHHLANGGDRRLVAIARLETAIAFVRRVSARVEPSRPGTLRLTPHARVVTVAAGGLDLLSALRAGGPEPPLGAGEEPALVLRTPATDGVAIEGLSPDLAVILARAETAVPRGELEAAVRSRGTDADEAAAVVDDLVADAILL